MTFGSLPWTKAQYAHTLAATLAYFLSRQGDGVGLLTFDDAIREYLPARNRPGHLRHLMLLLETPATGAGTDINAALNRIIDVVTRRGLVVLISDLLTPLESLEKNLAALAAWGHEIILFQILDPSELKFSFDKASLFEDVESRRGLYIDPGAARRDYLRRFEAHNASVQTIADKIGASYVRFGTDRPLEFALFDFLRARVERRKHSRRAGSVVTRKE